MSYKIKLDIIIITYNAKQKLRTCLHSIIKNTKHHDYTLTVIDNHSTDGSWELLTKLGNKLNPIRMSKNMGFSVAANFALKQTNHELIALCDDDIEVPSGWVEGLYAQMHGRTDIAIVGPKVILPNGEIFSSDCSFKKGLSRGAGELDRGQRDYIRNSDALTGPCWLMRRSVFKKVGEFDEEFFPCRGEDTDYCLRVRLAGYKIIYNGQIKVIHHNLFRTLGKAKKNNDLYWKKWGLVIEKLALKDITLSEKYYENGQNYLNQGEYLKAKNWLLKAEHICPGLISPYLLGISSFKTAARKEAKRRFEQALLIYPYSHRFFQGSLFYLSLLSMNIKNCREKEGIICP